MNEEDIPPEVLSRIDKHFEDLVAEKMAVWPPLPYSAWTTDRVHFMAREAALAEYLRHQQIEGPKWVEGSKGRPEPRQYHYCEIKWTVSGKVEKRRVYRYDQWWERYHDFAVLRWLDERVNPNKQ